MMNPFMRRWKERSASEKRNEQTMGLSGTLKRGRTASAHNTSEDETDGMLDMIIAFDTTGSMATYIDDVRQQVADLVPGLFADNKNLRLGIVAFGDYCDMRNAQEFGKAYQCIEPTNDWRRIVDFVKQTQDTSGGDGDEFYELVIKKIVEETPWRPAAEHAVLLIADASPHKLGYSFRDYVVDNRIDWKEEAQKASDRGIKIDTVMVEQNSEWMKTVSKMTNGVCVPFVSSHNTARLVETATLSRGTKAQRRYVEEVCACQADKEMDGAIHAYAEERSRLDSERRHE